MNDERSGTGPAAEELDPDAVGYISSLLTDEMLHQSGQVDWTKARMVLARAGLERIRRRWRILFGHGRFAARASNDEEIYQRLRAGVLAQLNDRVEYERARKLARDVVPEELPTSEDLVTMDSEIYGAYESGFQRLDAELIRLALAAGIDPDTRNAEAYFVTFDDGLNRLEPEAAAQYQRWARRLGLTKDESPTEPAAPAKSRRGGRRPIPFEYETAQRQWWEMVDEYGEREEPRQPSQRDFCDWLAPKGVPIGERSLRTHIGRWRAQGLPWPPPRPDQAAPSWNLG